MQNNLNLKNWPRIGQFNLFKNYDNPYFNICTDIDVTELYNYVEANNLSFFICSLYLSLKAVNEIEEFKYRIKENEVIIFDHVNAGSTVLNDDDTFSFCYFVYSKKFSDFYSSAKKELDLLKTNGGDLDPRDNELNMIHYSVIPWISFNSISHPRKLNTDDSIPKIVFGKYNLQNNRMKMPISVEVHHSLMDGFHVGKYLSHLQNLLDSPEQILMDR